MLVCFMRFLFLSFHLRVVQDRRLRDMHDFDSAQTPILIDAKVNGRLRKLVSTGARNGFFFTVDRTNGEFIASGKYSPATNWASGFDDKGRPKLNPEKVATVAGSLVRG